MSTPLLELVNIRKGFGSVNAVEDVSLVVAPAEVVCLLGDNGAGKSTLIKLIAGVFQPDQGSILWDGELVSFESPKAAIDKGIATVYQDLAMLPMMSVARNFFVGHEPLERFGPLKVMNLKLARRVASEELQKLGIGAVGPDQPVGVLSGGERQSIAAAKAIYFGARLLVLDEPTSALGVKEAGLVLRHVRRAADEGLAVVLITHNVHHAFAVGDRFVVLEHGRKAYEFSAGEVTMSDALDMMTGETLEELRADIRGFAGDVDPPSSNP